MENESIGFSEKEAFSDAVFWGMNKDVESNGSSVKHLPGQHDQESHGSWARGRMSGEESSLITFLKQMEGLRGDPPEDQEYVSLETLILEHGQFFTPPSKGDELPKGVERGEMKQCFHNSLMNIRPDFYEGGELTYVEGYATSGLIPGYPFHHAWLVDENNKVVDPTWNAGHGLSYFGIKFNNRFVTKMALRDKISGIFHMGTMGEFLTDGLPDDALYDVSSTKHLQGKHDQESHGNWADGISKVSSRPDVKFGTALEAEQWLVDNAQWTGGVGFVFDDEGKEINDNDKIVFAETLAELKALGLPGVQSERRAAWLIDPEGTNAYYDRENIQFGISAAKNTEFEEIQADNFRYVISNLESKKEWRQDKGTIEKYKEHLDVLLHGDKREIHSMYYFPQDRSIESTVRHEYGHFFHHWQKSVRGEMGGVEQFFEGDDKPTVQEFGITQRARDNWGEAVAENFVLWSIGETENISPRITAEFDELVAWNKVHQLSSTKHLQGKHDQESHGNWADGISKVSPRPDVKFANVAEANRWYKDNYEWTGEILFMGQISKEDEIEIFETLAELKALGLPNISEYRKQKILQTAWENPSRFIFNQNAETSMYKSEIGMIFVSTKSLEKFDEDRITTLESAIEESIKKGDTETAAKYKSRLNTLLHGDKKLSHSVYYFPPERNVEATLRHEFGHFFHAWSQQTIYGMPEGLNDLRWDNESFEYGEGATWETKFGVTERAKDNWNEIVAENFVLWSIGETDKIHPMMTKRFDGLAEWNKWRSETGG